MIYQILNWQKTGHTTIVSLDIPKNDQMKMNLFLFQEVQLEPFRKRCGSTCGAVVLYVEALPRDPMGTKVREV